VLAAMSKDLTLDEKVAVLAAARGLMDAVLAAEMLMEHRQRILDSVLAKPVPFGSRRH